MPRPVVLCIACAAGALTLAGATIRAAQGASSLTFTDIAAQAGLTVPSVYGGLERKRFIIETNGAGVAWVDVDHDGWLDALVLGGTRLTQGARVEDPTTAGAGPTTRLYRNTGHGTFADVSDKAGVAKEYGPALGVVAADFEPDADVLAVALRNQLLVIRPRTARKILRQRRRHLHKRA